MSTTNYFSDNDDVKFFSDRRPSTRLDDDGFLSHRQIFRNLSYKRPRTPHILQTYTHSIQTYKLNNK